MCGAGFFYLVDSGYGCYRGFLPPFRRERYHLQTFQHGQELPRTMREMFNYRHSSLWIVAERSFAVLKNWFPILYKVPPYSLRYQRLFVITCFTLHNFIRKYSETEDPFFKEALTRLNPWVDEDDRQEQDMASNVSPGERQDQSEASSVVMGQGMQWPLVCGIFQMGRKARLLVEYQSLMNYMVVFSAVSAL
jgi:hypothetical protein